MAGGGAVLNKKVIEIGLRRNFNRQTRVDLSEALPEIPVLPETVLLMELCTRGRSVDLMEMSNLVLRDPGATLQIMRQAGRGGPLEDERFNRIEDYISALGVEACMEAVSRRTIGRSMDKPAILESWSHARVIAEECRLLAAEMPSKTNPDEAYLTGILHELGSFPMTLNWDRGSLKMGNPELAGFRLAQTWRLPRCVREYFSGLQDIANANQWTELVQCAHETENSSTEARGLIESPAVQDMADERCRRFWPNSGSHDRAVRDRKECV
jgi:HD-like signal output (HDOD) protein